MDQFAIQAESRDGINLGIFWNAKGQDPYPVNDDAHRLVSDLIFTTLYNCNFRTGLNSSSSGLHLELI